MSAAEQKEWIGNDVTLRWLGSEEYFRLEFLFLANSSQMPSPTTSRVIVAEDSNGDIVGMFCLQIVAHGEPIWVSDDFQRRGVAKLMIDEMNQHCDQNRVGYFSFAEDERVAHICRENQMVELPYKVFLRKPE